MTGLQNSDAVVVTNFFELLPRATARGASVPIKTSLSRFVVVVVVLKEKQPGLVSSLTSLTILTIGSFQKSKSLFQKNNGHYGGHC